VAKSGKPLSKRGQTPVFSSPFERTPLGGGVKFNRGSAVPEMLIAVVILGVVASIAAPRFFNNSPF